MQPNMSHLRDGRSASPDSSGSPARGHRRMSRSRSLEDASNPGNNLYVTGLSTRVTTSDLEKYFGKEGKVIDCHLVTDPHTRESRGFGFVTMESNEDASRCIKYLNHSVLEGRLITVEKAKRIRARTPTPGKYRGTRDRHGGQGRRRSRSYSPHGWDRGYGRYPYPNSKGRRRISRSPYSRRPDDYAGTYKRHGARSLSPGRDGYP
ncbi:hypothetical protein Nepgr_011224 [Nepenthes gracilis]|uniref:RRM domain-containing protein n=1 Tax=Nepenthes gracilis TaxID=150966 RepID=A0AAD3SDX4_NEPGR|nr:hypothetical protein Nepgr_011224 [Nepenthes gracilis]